MTDENDDNDRMVIIGRVEETTDKQTKVRYEAQSGSRVISLPRNAIGQQVKTHDGQIAFLVTKTKVKHGYWKPSDKFSGVKAPLINESEHVELVDAIEQGAAKSNLQFLVKEQKGEGAPDLFGGSTDTDDYDDSVPLFADGMEVGDDPWDGGLVAGGRDALIAEDWRFEPSMMPCFVALTGTDTIAPTFAPCNDQKGNSAAWAVFNPTYASDERPAGALLGTVGKDYYPLAYPVVYDPILAIAAENGWKAKVYAYKEGAKSRLDCDVSQATQSLNEAREKLAEGGHPWLSTALMSDSAKSLDGLYRYGFSIGNSLDGTTALKIQIVAQRVYCTNLTVMGGVQTIAALRHKKGAMKGRDWDKFATQINNVIVEAQRNLVDMEFLQHIPVDTQLFERMITLCERNGLITWPKMTPQEQGADKVTGGYMWRLAMDGWTNPRNDWVNVSNDQTHSLYHVYNILNGAITHKPEWTDGSSKLTGRVIGLDTFDRRLRTVHNTVTGVAMQTIQNYRDDADVDRIGSGDLSDLKSYVNENGLIALNEIPKASKVLGL